MNDGERTILGMKSAESKRLMYKQLLGRGVTLALVSKSKAANILRRKRIPGPKVDRLKLRGRWQDAMKTSLTKKKTCRGLAKVGA